MLSISVSTKPVEKQISNLQSSISNFSWAWDDIITKILHPTIRQIFESDGRGRWPRRKDNLPHPLLRKSGRLFASLTNTGHRDNINRQTATSLTYGTNVPYSSFHEEGTSRIPARSFLQPIAEDASIEEQLSQLLESNLQGRINRR